MFSRLFCIHMFIFLALFSCWDKTKGANQGQGGVFERGSHVSPLPYGFPLSNPFPLPIPLYWRARTIKMVENKLVCR